jgi:outer membrane protein assembly factor BamB
MAITQEQRGAEEAIVAYDLATGAVRWVHAYPARYATVVAGEGPRATPAVAGDRLVAHGATGVLTAVDRRTGRRAWQRDLPREHEAPEPEWGRSSSPLVLGDRVIVNAGGTGGRSLVAHALATGELAWAGGGDRVGYASPVLVTLAGVPQVVAFNIASVTAHEPETGAVLWEHPWPGRQPNVSQPLPVGDDRLLVSSGYGVGSALLRIRRDDDGALKPTVLWESPRLKAKFTNLVLHDGFVYGLDDGVLVCLDLETGERRWKSGRYGHGQVLLVEGVLLVQTEEGEVVLVDPQPERHVEVARFQALDGKTWNPPALAGRYLLVRNDREAAMYELPTCGDAGAFGAAGVGHEGARAQGQEGARAKGHAVYAPIPAWGRALGPLPLKLALVPVGPCPLDPSALLASSTASRRTPARARCREPLLPNGRPLSWPTVVSVLSKTTVSAVTSPRRARSAKACRSARAMASPARYSTGPWLTSSSPSSCSSVARVRTIASIEQPDAPAFDSSTPTKRNRS